MENVGRLNTQTRIITKAAKPDDDADRDPDGLISDEQVERDIEQLQRDNAEEQHVVISMNGNGKSVHDDVYELMVKSLSGLHVEIEEVELRRRCEEVALEVAFAAERVLRDAHNALGGHEHPGGRVQPGT